MAGHMRTRREFAIDALAVAGGAALAADAAAAPLKGRLTVTVDARPEPVAIDRRTTAVLVIDMQNDFGADEGMFAKAGIDLAGIKAVVPRIARTLELARAASMPVIYLKMAFLPDLSDAGPVTAPNLIKHAACHPGSVHVAPNGKPSRVLIRDTWNSDIIPELAPKPGDAIVYKSRFSGFYRTQLDEILKRNGIAQLIVTGCTTSVCVESTVRDAMFRDYQCLILEDCVAEPIGAELARSNHEASLLTMQILFAWISDSTKLDQALKIA